MYTGDSPGNIAPADAGTLPHSLAFRTNDPRNRRTVCSPLPFPRLYRAHVTAADISGVERTAFVEAASHRAAARKIANVVAAIENRLPDQVEERIYNVYSSSEFIEEGLSVA
jgi:hypothetical protein